MISSIDYTTSATASRVFSLPNLSAKQIDGDLGPPWLNQWVVPVFESKEQYRKWHSNPETEHPMFSLIEGDVPSLRVDSTNEPRKIHGFVADYDSEIDDAEFRSGIERARRQDIYAYNRTFSGGVRVVWLFDEPINYPGKAAYTRLLKKAKKELHVAGLFPGLDDRPWDNASQYYVGGGNWEVVGTCLSSAAAHLWLYDTFKNEDFDSRGIEIPIEMVAAEVERKYPNRWSGEFKVGARGSRFWENGADATSVIVCSTGCLAYTGGESFLTWERLLGRDFVEKFRTEKIGHCIRDLHYDGQTYYRRLEGRWDQMNLESIRRHLRVAYGLSPNRVRGENDSELECAIYQIQTHKRVASALPFPHNKEQIVRFNGSEYLNTSTVRVTQPAELAPKWGENFPWISDFIDGLFIETKQKEIFLSWMHLFYKQSSEGKPEKGQALFIAGPADTGKTLLVSNIVSKLVGGHADASGFVVNGDRFNSHLCERALWTIDDSLPGMDRNGRDRFSNLLKTAVANQTVRFEKKYAAAGDVPFNGRIAVTLNDDPQSLNILPNTDGNILDKIILLRTSDRRPPVHGGRHEMEQLISLELPHFARYLLDYQIPTTVKRSERFGIESEHDPELLSIAKDSSPAGRTFEALNVWRAYYGELLSQNSKWEGSVTELHGLLRDCSKTRSFVENIQPTTLGRYLSQLERLKGEDAVPWIKRVKHSKYESQKVQITLPGHE